MLTIQPLSALPRTTLADSVGETVVDQLRSEALQPGHTWFGFVTRGPCTLEHQGRRTDLAAGMYFSLPAPDAHPRIHGGEGELIGRVGFEGLFGVGGPIDPAGGRLRYIDGCTDTLLIGPPLRGDPCLNYLHIPPGTRQTMHSHPTSRAGVVAFGHGRCRTPDGEQALSPGDCFIIEAGMDHCFHTDGQALGVIAYHPDSDTGPDHEDHPMVNRTYVGEISARHLPDLRT